MAIGYPITKQDLDNKMGRLIQSVRDDLAACVAFKALLDDVTVLPDAALSALGYGAGEIAVIRAAFAAMATLNSLSHAGATLPTANDFFFDAKHLTGIN